MDEYNDSLLNCLLWITTVFLLVVLIVGCTPQHNVIPNPQYGECHEAIQYFPNATTDCVFQHL